MAQRSSSCTQTPSRRSMPCEYSYPRPYKIDLLTQKAFANNFFISCKFAGFSDHPLVSPTQPQNTHQYNALHTELIDHRHPYTSSTEKSRHIKFRSSTHKIFFFLVSQNIYADCQSFLEIPFYA